MAENIEQRVVRVAADLFNLAPEEIGLNSSPQQIEVWDSMQHLNLVLALEQEFEIQFGPEQIERMKSIGEIVRFVEEMSGPSRIENRTNPWPP